MGVDDSESSDDEAMLRAVAETRKRARKRQRPENAGRYPTSGEGGHSDMLVDEVRAMMHVFGDATQPGDEGAQVVLADALDYAARVAVVMQGFLGRTRLSLPDFGALLPRSTKAYLRWRTMRRAASDGASGAKRPSGSAWRARSGPFDFDGPADSEPGGAGDDGDSDDSDTSSDDDDDDDDDEGVTGADADAGAAPPEAAGVPADAVGSAAGGVPADPWAAFLRRLAALNARTLLLTEREYEAFVSCRKAYLCRGASAKEAFRASLRARGVGDPPRPATAALAFVAFERAATVVEVAATLPGAELPQQPRRGGSAGASGGDTAGGAADALAAGGDEDPVGSMRRSFGWLRLPGDAPIPPRCLRAAAASLPAEPAELGAARARRLERESMAMAPAVAKAERAAEVRAAEDRLRAPAALPPAPAAPAGAAPPAVPASVAGRPIVVLPRSSSAGRRRRSGGIGRS